MAQIVDAQPAPQSGTGWRGIVNLNPSVTNMLIVTPTQRQIYLSPSDMKTIQDSVVYSVPTASGRAMI